LLLLSLAMATMVATVDMVVMDMEDIGTMVRDLLMLMLNLAMATMVDTVDMVDMAMGATDTMVRDLLMLMLSLDMATMWIPRVWWIWLWRLQTLW